MDKVASSSQSERLHLWEWIFAFALAPFVGCILLWLRRKYIVKKEAEKDLEKAFWIGLGIAAVARIIVYPFLLEVLS